MQKFISAISLALLAIIAIYLFKTGGHLNDVNASTSMDQLAEDESGEYSTDNEDTLDNTGSISDYLAAITLEREGNYKDAVNFYEKVIETYESATTNNSYNDSQKNITSELDADKVEAIYGKLFGFYLYLGEYEKAFNLAKQKTSIIRSLHQLKDSKDKIEKVSYTPYLLLALKEFKEENHAEVINLLTEVSSYKPLVNSHLDGVVLPLMLSWAYVAENKYTEALDVIDSITTDFMLSVFSYNRAIINDIANNKEDLSSFKGDSIKERTLYVISDIFTEIGNFSFESKNFKEAIVYYRIANYIDTENNYLHKLIALCLEVDGKYEEAISAYKKITDKNDIHYAESKLRQAISYSALRQIDEARSLLEELFLDEKYAYKAKATYGKILLNEKLYQQAIEAFNDAENSITSYSIENSDLFFSRAISYNKLGNWNSAEKDLIRSIELMPENAEALNYLAYSWITMNKNIDKSLKMLEKSLLLSGGAPHILDSYGWALYQLGRYEQALPFLEQAANATPYNSVINSHLGDVYWQLGRKQEAKYKWQRAFDNFEAENSDEVTKEQLKIKLKDGL